MRLYKKEGKMIIGIPKEIKQDEYRVSFIPVGVEEMMAKGHTVLVEKGAGMGSGFLLVRSIDWNSTGQEQPDLYDCGSNGESIGETGSGSDF